MEKEVKYFEVTAILRVDSATGKVIACVRETPEIVEAFESLPNVDVKTYSTFSHLSPAKSDVFITRWDKK